MNNYVDTFSKEWLIHRRTQLDSQSGSLESLNAFYDKTGLDPEEVRGKLVLDAGCGTGRFMEIALNIGASLVVGVDMSEAADVARENFKDNKRAGVLKRDLHDLPYPDESFNVIISLGVLHHTPYTKGAFNSLLRLLKPGGIISIWVYPDEPWHVWLYNRITGFYRTFTTRMPMGLLYKLCWLARPLYYLRKIPVLGKIFSLFLPISGHPDPEWRQLDTYDWYSPKFQFKHRWDEVEEWFKEAGLVNIKRNKIAVSFRGEKK